jgi:hypothetical protein
MELIRKKGPRSSVVLLSVAALALAMTGILYAHWTDVLEVRAEVNTGEVAVEWIADYTNDDGVEDEVAPGTFLTPVGDNGSNGVYSYWGFGEPGDDSVDGASSSPDPNGPEFGFPRTDKDVGRCTSEVLDDGTLHVLFENVYPDYECTWAAVFENTGSIPVKLQDVAMSGGAAWLELVGINFRVINEDGSFGPVFFGREACGMQFDPTDRGFYLEAHYLLQEAPQGGSVETFTDIEFVNWNEYDELACDGSIPSFPAP